jgi:hypothetical protein
MTTMTTVTAMSTVICGSAVGRRVSVVILAVLVGLHHDVSSQHPINDTAVHGITTPEQYTP